MSKDPYYTYTDYWPAQRTSRKVSGWLIMLACLLVIVLILAISGLQLLPWLVLLQGAL